MRNKMPYQGGREQSNPELVYIFPFLKFQQNQIDEHVERLPKLGKGHYLSEAEKQQIAYYHRTGT